MTAIDERPAHLADESKVLIDILSHVRRRKFRVASQHGDPRPSARILTEGFVAACRERDDGIEAVRCHVGDVLRKSLTTVDPVLCATDRPPQRAGVLDLNPSDGQTALLNDQ